MNTQQHPEEYDVRAALDDLVDRLDVPTQRIAAGGLARGRRMRARRRLGAVAGVAAVAVAAGVSLPVARQVGAGDGDTSVAAGTPVRSAVPTPQAGPDGAAVGPWRITARKMLGRLRPLLPEGAVASKVEYVPSDPAPGQKGPARGYLFMELDTGGGPGGFNLLLGPPTEAATPSTPAPDLEPGESRTLAPGTVPSDTRLRCAPSSAEVRRTCEVRVRPDGSPFAMLEERVHDGVTEREVVVVQPNGMDVRLIVGNSTHYKWTGPATTAEPPLTLAQMLDIASSDTWQ